MVACDVLDFRCVFVNEIFGSAVLTVLAAVILWFIFSNKMRISFRISIMTAFAILPIFGMMFAGFMPMFAFLSAIAAIFMGRKIYLFAAGER